MIRQLLFFLLIYSSISFYNAQAQSGATLTATVAQDPVFGFYPSVFASVPLNDNISLNAYGVFYTAPGLGAPDGTALFTEFGGGATFSLLEGKLLVTPTIAILGGKLLSGADRPVMGDGIVPALALYYADGDFSVTGGGVWWKALRKEGAIQTNFYQIYAIPTVALSSTFSMGLHNDVLWTATSPGESVVTYWWLGPRVTVASSGGASVSFSFGADLADYGNSVVTDKKVRDFYKLSASFMFQ